MGRHLNNSQTPHQSRLDHNHFSSKSSATNGQSSRTNEDPKSGSARNSLTASQASATEHIDLDSELSDLDFEFDLQTSSSSDGLSDIVDDQTLKQYQKILGHYNSEYGLNQSEADFNSVRDSPKRSLRPTTDFRRQRPLKGSHPTRLNSSIDHTSSFTAHHFSRSTPSSSVTDPHHYDKHLHQEELMAKHFSHKKRSRRHNSIEGSYFHDHHLAKWVTLVSVVVLACFGGMYYEHSHDQATQEAAYQSTRPVKIHHHRSRSLTTADSSVNAGQKKQVKGLVNHLYGRVNKLINSSDQTHIAQIKFSSVPLSQFFVAGTNNNDCQTLMNRCKALKAKTAREHMRIKSVIPAVDSIQAGHKRINVHTTLKIQLLSHGKNSQAAVKSHNLKHNELTLVKHRGKYQIISMNNGSLF